MSCKTTEKCTHWATCAGPEALAKFTGISFQEAKAFADKENSNDSRNLPPGTLGSGSGNDPVYIFVSTP